MAGKVTSMIEIRAKTRDALKAVKALRNEFKALGRDLNKQSGSLGSKKLAKDLQRTKIETQKAKTALAQYKLEAIKAATATKMLTDRTKALRDGMFRVRAAMMDVRHVAQQVATTMGFALMGAGFAIKGFGDRLLEGAASIEMFQKQFGTLMKSMQAGKDAFKTIQQFALKSPLTLKETLDATKALLSFGHTFGEIIKSNTGLLETMTKAAIFSGKSMTQVVEALEKLRSGTLLQRSLTPIRITPALFKEMGLEMRGRRPVLADTDPEELYRRVIAKLQEMFEDFNPEDMIQVKLANVIDKWDIMWQTLGANAGDGLKRVLDQFHEFLDNLIAYASSPAVGNAMQHLLDNIITPLLARGVEAFDKLTNYLEQHPTALTDAINAFVEGIKSMITLLVGGVVTAAVATLLQMLASLVLAFTNPVSGVIAVLGILVGAGGFMALKRRIDDLIPSVNKATEAVGSERGTNKALVALQSIIKTLATSVIGNLVDAFTSLKSIVVDANGELTAFGKIAETITTTHLTNELRSLEMVLLSISGVLADIAEFLTVITGGDTGAAIAKHSAVALEKTRGSMATDPYIGIAELGALGYLAPSSAISSGIGDLRLIEAESRQIHRPTQKSSRTSAGGGGGTKESPAQALLRGLTETIRDIDWKKKWRSQFGSDVLANKEAKEAKNKALVAFFESLADPALYAAVFALDPDQVQAAEAAYRTMIGGNLRDSLLSGARSKVGGAIGQAADRLSESQKAELTAAKEQVTIAEAVVAQFEKVIDELKDFADALRDAADNLFSGRGSLVVAMQRALGLDRGADVATGSFLHQAMARAFASPLSSNSIERAGQLTARANAVEQMFNFAGGLRGNPQARDIMEAAIADAMQYMGDLPQQMESLEQVIGEELQGVNEEQLAAAKEHLSVARGQLDAELAILRELGGTERADAISAKVASVKGGKTYTGGWHKPRGSVTTGQSAAGNAITVRQWSDPAGLRGDYDAWAGGASCASDPSAPG